MAINLPPHTSQQEFDAIKDHFGNNYEAIDQALLTGVMGSFQAEDLMAYRLESSGELPSFMVATGDIPSPDDAPWLWEDKEIDTYRFWQNNDVKLKDAMDKLLAQVPVDYSDIIQGAAGFETSESTGIDETGSADKVPDNDGSKGLDMGKQKDLEEFMAAQVDAGNMSGAITAYAIYSFGPEQVEANAEILSKFEEGEEHIQELLDNLSALNPEDAHYQSQSQEIQIQINRIQETNKALLGFIQQLHDMKLELLEMASSLERRQAQTISTIIGNF